MAPEQSPAFPAPFASIGVVEGPATRLSEEGETIRFMAARVALQHDNGEVSYHFHRFSGSWGAEQLASRIVASQGATGTRIRTDTLDASCWSAPL